MYTGDSGADIGGGRGAISGNVTTFSVRGVSGDVDGRRWDVVCLERGNSSGSLLLQGVLDGTSLE